MFAIVNIVIVIITGKSHARTRLWLKDDSSQFYLVPFSNPSGGKYSMVRGLSSRFRSMLFNGVLLVFSIRPQVSQQPPAKLTDDHPLRKSLATWPNKYHWFESGISPEKHWLWIVFVGQIVVFFQFSTIFFQKCIKARAEKCSFPTTKNILYFYFYCVRFSLYIFQR